MVSELELKLYPMTFHTSNFQTFPEKVSSIFFWMTLIIFSPIFILLATAFPHLSKKIDGLTTMPTRISAVWVTWANQPLQ